MSESEHSGTDLESGSSSAGAYPWGVGGPPFFAYQNILSDLPCTSHVQAYKPVHAHFLY